MVCTEVLKSVDIDMMRGKSSNNRDSSAATPPLFDGNYSGYLPTILQDSGILRLVSTNSLHWRKGSDIPESDENVHTWVPYRKMHVTFDWYEDSIYDETAASAVDLHTTFTHRPDFEDSKNSISLQDCLSQYTQVENIEYRCGECRNSSLQRKN